MTQQQAAAAKLSAAAAAVAAAASLLFQVYKRVSSYHPHCVAPHTYIQTF